MNIFNSFQNFAQDLFFVAQSQGFDLLDFKIDHVAYQTNSKEEYDTLVIELANIAQMLSENIVREMRVGIIKLHQPLEFNQQQIAIVELVDPPIDKLVDSHWEHFEFLTPLSYEELLTKYPNLDWNTSAVNRDQFPMLTLKLNDKYRVKFPKNPVVEEIKRII